MLTHMAHWALFIGWLQSLFFSIIGLPSSTECNTEKQNPNDALCVSYLLLVIYFVKTGIRVMSARNSRPDNARLTRYDIFVLYLVCQADLLGVG